MDTVVNVSAAAETLLNSESAAVGQAITTKSIEDLPLNGRNFVQLTQLTTGAAPVGVGTSQAITWTGRTDTTVSFVGSRESDTSYLVNCIETRNARFGNTGAGYTPDVGGNGNFGVITSTHAGSGRVVQLGGRFTF